MICGRNVRHAVDNVTDLTNHPGVDDRVNGFAVIFREPVIAPQPSPIAGRAVGLLRHVIHVHASQICVGNVGWMTDIWRSLQRIGAILGMFMGPIGASNELAATTD